MKSENPLKPASKLRTLIIIGSLLFALTATGLFLMAKFSTQDVEGDQVIKIGLIAPLTGSNQAGGVSMLHGVRLAVENINKRGGVNGRQIELISYDDADTPSECLAATKRLIFIDNAEAIIGPFSSRCALEIKGLINSCGIPLIMPVAMADSLNQEDDYVFRNTLGVSEAQSKINDFVDEGKGQYILLEGFKAKTMGIIWQDDLWGEAMFETVKADLVRLGKEDALTFSASFTLGQSEFSKLFVNENGNYPDLIYVISSGAESIPLVREGREAGFAGIFIGEGGFNSDNFDEQLGAYADGCVFSTQWHPSFSTPMSDVFLKAYKSKYQTIPDMFAALSYESVYLLRDSLSHVTNSLGEDDFSDILRNDLSKTKVFSGFSGPIYYNELGQADRDVFILQKRWDGNDIQAFIIFPTKYSQNSIKWNFEISD
jgi:branched-chain amino acid transport system substrate-binding protein